MVGKLMGVECGCGVQVVGVNRCRVLSPSHGRQAYLGCRAQGIGSRAQP